MLVLLVSLMCPQLVPVRLARKVVCLCVCGCVSERASLLVHVHALHCLITIIVKERKFKIPGFKRGKQATVDTSTTSNGPTA